MHMIITFMAIQMFVDFRKIVPGDNTLQYVRIFIFLQHVSVTLLALKQLGTICEPVFLLFGYINHRCYRKTCVFTSICLRNCGCLGFLRESNRDEAVWIHALDSNQCILRADRGSGFSAHTLLRFGNHRRSATFGGEAFGLKKLCRGGRRVRHASHNDRELWRDSSTTESLRIHRSSYSRYQSRKILEVIPT